MFHPEKFCPSLNQTEWMGSFCEVGMGVTFQAQYLSEPGASSTVLFSHSPYHKDVQPQGLARSVSKEMAIALAERDLLTNPLLLKDVEGAKRFALAVTASHKNAGERGASHGWVAVVTCDGSIPTRDNLEHHVFHFNLKKSYEVEMGKVTSVKNVGRAFAGALYAWKIRWFLSKVLLKSWDNWGEAIDEMPRATYDTIDIDVIESPDILVEDHLKLASENNPLVYHEGSFQRVDDYFRKHKKFYRGSFNPPTLSHVAAGEGALFEIEISNARKGKSTFEDLAHRVRMVSLTGNPLLINSGRPLFIELHRSLRERGLTDLEYIVGVDTFNDIVNKKYIPYDGFLEPFYKGGSGKLLVLPRAGIEVVTNKFTDLVSWEYYKADYPSDFSSTAVRKGELNQTEDSIVEYIIDNNLYGLNV